MELKGQEMSSKDDKNEFLKYSIQNLESRIDLMDRKANILIAINAGLAALVTFIIKEIFWNNSSTQYIKILETVAKIPAS